MARPMRSLLLLVVCGLLASLVGCGGGSSGQTQPPQPTNVLAYLHRVGESITYQVELLKSDGTTSPLASTNSYISVVLAPNGKQILFSYWNGTNYEIATMNTDGTGMTQLASGLYPQYTPDGSRIVYESSRQVAVMNADGSNQTVITNLAAGQFCFPATNGSVIAVGMYGIGEQGLVSMNMDGSNTQLLVSTVYSVFPAFSSDGSQIIFSNSGGQDENIYSISTTGSNLVQLTNSFENWDPLVVGNKIYFDYIPPSIQNSTVDNNQIYSMGVDGSNLTAVTNDTLYDGFKTWNGLCLNP